MEIPTTVGALIGLVGAPFLIVMVVRHLLVAVQGEEIAGIAGPRRGPRDLSLVLRDVVGLAVAFLLRESGGLAQVLDAGVVDNVATVVLVGLALSFVAGQLYDRMPALAGASRPSA